MDQELLWALTLLSAEDASLKIDVSRSPPVLKCYTRSCPSGPVELREEPVDPAVAGSLRNAFVAVARAAMPPDLTVEVITVRDLLVPESAEPSEETWRDRPSLL